MYFNIAETEVNLMGFSVFELCRTLQKHWTVIKGVKTTVSFRSRWGILFMESQSGLGRKGP